MWKIINLILFYDPFVPTKFQTLVLFLTMKTLLILSLSLLLTNCTAHSVKIGKRCTNASEDGSFEKSFVWVVDKKSISSFDQKINRENCKKNS